MSRRAPLRVLVAALAVLVGPTALSAGCAGVPDSSDVQVVRSVPAGPEPVPARVPQPGVSPFRLVRDFIAAMGNPANDHAAARAFLTDAAARSWRDGRGVTLIRNGPDTTPQPGGDGPAGTARVLVRADRIGTLTRTGAFRPDAGRVEMVLELVTEDGEWRITDPPAGVLVDSSSFARAYRGISVWFVDPNRNTLVPDYRWVRHGPAGTLPGRVFDLLLAGPSAHLAPAVESALARGAGARASVRVRPDGRTVVDLAGVADLGPAQRRLVAAQTVGSLDGLVPAPFRLVGDRRPLVVGKPDWRSSDITSYRPPAGPRPDVAGLVVSDGRLRTLGGRPVPGPAGSGSLRVRSAARSSPAGSQLAVVADSGRRSRLLVGAGGRQLSPVPLDAGSMTRPSWRPSGREVWTVLDGATVAGVVLPQQGAPSTYQVAAAELAELGRITELRLSPDGVHVAAIVGGELVVATVVDRPAEVRIDNPRVLRERTLPPAASVDWIGLDRLVVASAGTPPEVALVSVDGLTHRRLAGTNLTAPLSGVVGATGREILVADATGVWAYRPTTQVWEPVLAGIGPGAVPTYPG